MAVGTFKARCLTVIREVQATGEPVVITKPGAPVVQVTRVGSGKGDVFGFMAGEFKIVGDIESPVWLRRTSGREMPEPGVGTQIRTSGEEYRRGKKRDFGAFLAELRPKRKTQT